MSLLKSKSCLKGVLLAIFFAMASSAMAFTPEGGRLWKPYQPESFGGQRRSADGFFASVEGILWRVDGPKSIPVGYRNPDGSTATRTVFTNGQVNYNHRSSMNTGNISTDFSLGTRVEAGNVKGHHGWLFSGYGITGSGSDEQRNGSMVIHDPENLDVYCVYWADGAFNSIWNHEKGDFITYPQNTYYGTDLYGYSTKQKVANVGYLWAWHPVEWDDWMEGYLAPVPINFDRSQISNKANIVSLELMYTYRPHPFKWGEMELLAGARYWGFDDKFTFLGLGYEEAYEQYEEDYLNSGGNNNNNNNNNNSSSSSSSSNNNNDNGESGETLGEVNSNVLGPLSVLADTQIVGRVNNRITGPQFGVKFSRRNARWTFGAEGRFLAGINSQSHQVSGTLGTHFVDTSKVPTIGGGFIGGDSGGSSGSSGGEYNASLVNSGLMPYIPIGFTRDTQSFHHKRNKTVFSPGFELRLSAQWQWTDAVGIQLGFNSTIVDNIARGADIIEYTIQDDGTLFGMRSSKETVIVYGFNFGLNIRR